MRVAVVGGGSWGTALAQTLASAGPEVSLWARDPAVARHLDSKHTHPWALPGIVVDSRIECSSDLATALGGANIVLLAVPSHAMRDTAVACAPLVRGMILVSAAKGFETSTQLTMSGVLTDVLCGMQIGGIAALSGPNIALEVARGLPAATVIAAADPGVAGVIRDACNGGSLRFYSSDDVVGVEYAGALKNVVAIAAGICDGIGAGDNGKAALITRGIAEIARLAACAGAHPMTLAGLAGLGDCIVTCTSPHSRNRGLGEMIGRGTPPGEAIASSQMVIEGVNATRVAQLLAARYRAEIPIIREVHAVLSGEKAVSSALTALMARGAGDEFRGLNLQVRGPQRDSLIGMAPRGTVGVRTGKPPMHGATDSIGE